MSQENVEVARRFFEALGRRDYDAATPCLHPEVEWRNTASFPGPRSLVGPSAIFEFWEALIESFEPDWAAPANSRQVGFGHLHRGAEDERHVRRCRVALARAGEDQGGVLVDTRYAATVLVREGSIERIEISGDPAKALEAAGLSE